MGKKYRPYISLLLRIVLGLSCTFIFFNIIHAFLSYSHSRNPIENMEIHSDSDKHGFIDKIIYINLDKRTDKRTQTENEIKDLNIEYIRFPAIENKNGALGCSKSHLEVIRKAKSEGYKNLLVLEDDFEFIVPKSEFFQEIRKLFNPEIEFDVCLLAYNTPNLYDCGDAKYDEFLYRIKDAQTTSGYIVNSHYYDTLIDTWEKAVTMFEKTDDATKYTCDQSWKPLQVRDKWYCFKRRIGKQRAGYSDIQGGHVDYKV